jgi:hypothetical protein
MSRAAVDKGQAAYLLTGGFSGKKKAVDADRLFLLSQVPVTLHQVGEEKYNLGPLRALLT